MALNSFFQQIRDPLNATFRTTLLVLLPALLFAAATVLWPEISSDIVVQLHLSRWLPEAFTDSVISNVKWINRIDNTNYSLGFASLMIISIYHYLFTVMIVLFFPRMFYIPRIGIFQIILLISISMAITLSIILDGNLFDAFCSRRICQQNFDKTTLQIPSGSFRYAMFIASAAYMSAVSVRCFWDRMVLLRYQLWR